MKKIKISISVLLITGISVLSGCKNGGFSGSNFEGVINYDVKLDAGGSAGLANLANTVGMKTYVKGSLMRGEENMAGYNTVILGDLKNPSNTTMLLTMFGHNYAVQINDTSKDSPKIEYIDSTKEIAGYSCKKAKITINIPGGPPVSSYVYYTTDLPYADPQGLFKGLKGMPMEFTGNMEGVVISIAAKSVEKKTLSDSLFTVPAAYKKMTMADMEKDVRKNMGYDSTSAPPPADTNHQ